MKTIFDKAVREQLVHRIEEIEGDEKADWGKMNVAQMLKHNTYWNKWILGKEKYVYKQAFMGKLFGKMALKQMIKDEKPFDKNIPTTEEFKVKETTGDIESEKSEWISLLEEYENFSNPSFIHTFFGKMTTEQIGILVYKHTHHHLRQFGR
ncbi:DUF1569 domain-containing protein [Flagellimonas crocea]|uniref:DUF1569 domain-containing protein n=1 Tax=Flagellimonas crocea TaxID=3067311 RepID=UPI00296FA3E2|nr:DUF1569 domain-containing protein [Muricauda sp. DH64]